uniref:Uncharacterized protein n=1 Tax=Triticum urartu TaxID=4572 RepID=A0A8R7P632_TRIUA
MLQGCSLAPPVLRVVEVAREVEAVAVGLVRVDGVEGLDQVEAQDIVKAEGIGVTSGTSPGELVEEEELGVAEDQMVDTGLALDPDPAPAAVRVAPHQLLVAMDMPMLMVRVGVGVKVAVQMGLPDPELALALARDMVRVAYQRHPLLLVVVMVPATLMLVVLVTVVVAVTMEMVVVPVLVQDRPATMILLGALRMEEEEATVVAQLEAAPKVQALESGLALGLARDKPVVLAQMAQVMPPEWVAAWVVAMVVALMEEAVVVEAVDPDLEVAGTTKLLFVEQAIAGTQHIFIFSSFY